MTKAGLAEARFLGWSHIWFQLFIKSLQSSAAKLALSIAVISVGSRCLIESLNTAILATGFGSRSSLLSLVYELALAGVAEVARHVCILLVLHFGHLCSDLRNGVFAEFALVRSDTLFHLLRFETTIQRLAFLNLNVTY